jgi:hypothetical protein
MAAGDISGVTYLDGQSIFYQIILVSPVHGIVYAWLPDEFAINLTENWNFMVGAGAPAIVSGLSDIIFGGRPTNQYLTAQIWSGSSPLRIALPLHFVARRNAVREVINPIQTLLKAALPRKFGAGISAPGPMISSNGTKRGDPISLYIGSYFAISNLFIESIDPIFKGKLDVEGNPMEAQVTIRLSTLYSPMAEDIDTFLAPGVATGAVVPSTVPVLAP